ncbi:MAG: glycosyltransferase family 2 protein [Candidatus Omnitrophota bacterium]|nr:glycosyltransferase family 2 protein [Candidatus Omnitrophota bacterium]
MTEITAVIITKNEEQQISRCLDSLKSWVKEIIVIDDGSTDQTVSLAQKAGAKVIVQTSKGNFDGQRNKGIDEASSSWVFQMDADEVVPAQAAQAISDALAKNQDFVAFTLTRRDFIFGIPLTHIINAPCVKIFRKDKGRYASHKIHEILKIDGPIGHIATIIDHYNIASISQTLEKYNYYTDVESRVYLEENPDIQLADLKKNLMGRTAKLFYKNYIKQKAYKDGIYGLIWAILHGFYILLHWLKITEGAINKKRLKP